jgi:hypothetical protein
MKLIRVTDEQHQKAVSALQEYLNKLIESSLERVQEMLKAKGLSFYCTYEDWSANWLLKDSDARSSEGIEHVCDVMAAMRNDFQGDEIFDAADWAVLTAAAAERAVSWFGEGNVHNVHDVLDGMRWVNDAVYKAEAVKGLSDYRTMENCRTRKAEVLALLKENGYEVVI